MGQKAGKGGQLLRLPADPALSSASRLASSSAFLSNSSCLLCLKNVEHIELSLLRYYIFKILV